MAKTRVVVTIEKDSKGKIDEIAKKLEGKDATVEEQLPILNRIICGVEELNMQDLESIPGVKKVAKERTYKTQK